METKKRKNYKSNIKAAKLANGSCCVNCGCQDAVEWHHIVPLHMGGRDVPSNMIPLCHKCHMLAHESRSTWNGNAGRKGGRHRKYSLEKCEPVIADYVYCKIGKKELLRTLGSDSPQDWGINGCSCMKDFFEKHGIISFKNKIDLLCCKKNNGIHEGQEIGWIVLKSNEKISFYA